MPATDTDETFHLTEAENREALDWAAWQAIMSAGLPDDKAQWGADEYAAYLTEFRSIVLNNPDSFTPDTVAIAQRMDPARIIDETQIDPTKVEPFYYIARATDLLKPMVDAMQPISQVPGALMNALNSMIGAVNNFGKAASPGLLTIALLGAGIIWALSKSSGTIREARSVFR